MNILGFDPGKNKCGIAILNQKQTILYHQILTSDQTLDHLKILCEKYQIKTIIMGDQTTSKQWHQQLKQQLNPQISIIKIDERNSSLEARDLYWQMYPPKGLTKLIPQGLRIPPRPIDDLVAILLIKKYLSINN